MMLLSVDVLFILYLTSQGAWSHIYLKKAIKDCHDVDCGDNGTLDKTKCKCVCANEFTGHLCDTELKPSKFPRGNYALPAALIGCPEENESYGWMMGYINLTMTSITITDFGSSTLEDSVSRHYWSDDIHLLGPFHRRTVQLNFCSRIDQHPVHHIASDDDSAQPYWPPGNYCFFKVEELCPKEFRDGFILLEDYAVLQGKYDGMLPKVNLTSDAGVTLYFCCHHSDSSEEDVIFGDSSQFFLLKGGYTDYCPNIVDMDSQQEIFAFRKSGNTSWLTSGSVPFHAEDEQFFNISFCFYRPTIREDCMYLADEGASYRGSHNITKFGTACDDWTTIDNIDSRYAADLEENYCRRLTMFSRYPMCYSKSKSRSCEGIPVCEDKITQMENVAYFKRVDSPPGSVFKPNENLHNSTEEYLNQQLIVNGLFCCSERVNFRISPPVIEPYFKVDLGFSHKIYGAIIHRELKDKDAGSFWQRMVLWISRDEWSFLTFGSYMCGGMINAHKNDKHLFVCEAPMIGRYVTLQTNVHSDPDIVPYEYLNLQINELIVYGKATKCGRLLGLMTGEVTLAQITTSSFIDGFHSNQSRLNENGPGWCPKVEDKKPFIKVNLLLPMLVEGVIIQGWLHNDGNLKFISSFKVLYGFNYDNMAYYSDSFGPKVFYISNEAEYNFTQTFWFSKPFLTGIVGLEIPSEENSCLKAEFIVCKRNVERNCASAPKIGWQSLTERSIPGVKFQTGRRTSSYSACLQKCKRTSLCNAFQYNNSSRACRLSIDQPLPPSYSFRITRNLSFTYKLCVEEVTFPQNISSETIITSPNYPHYYGDHIEYIWNVRVTDAVALNIDVLDVFMPTVDNDKSGLLCYDRLDFGQNEKHANRVEIASKQDQHYHRQSRIISEKGNQLFIRIKSCYANRAMPFRGFAIKITKSDCPACKRKQDCTYPCGYIQSHYFPTGMYQKSSSAVIFKAYTIRGNSYEYVKIHIIYLDVPEKRTVFLSFADISPEGTSITTNIDGISMPYPIFYSQNNFLHVSCPYSVSTENNGYQLRYSLMKMRNWKESVYHMNTSKCEPGWMFFEGSCYTVTQFSERTYLEARRSCKSNGADLAIITSIEESNAINFYLLSHRNFVSPDVVFGLGVKDNKYKWIDGSRAIFQNWFMDWSNVHNARPSLPMVDACAVLRLTSSQSSSNWIVQRCRTNYTNAICEKRLYKDISANLKPVRYNLKLANRTLRKTTFKCIDGSLIDWTGRCDQFNDCPDNSDEFSCDLSSSSSDCKVQEFQCENKQCIPISRYCDYIQDCDDASDERACVRPDCNNDEFRCENGQCVPDSDRCDIKIDCLDESDELDCANVNCTNGGKLFSCPGENACIPMSNVCDGFVDCPGTSGYDEANCEHVMIKSSCEEWYRDGFRQSGTYKIDLGRIVGVVDIKLFSVECEFDDITGIISTVIHHTDEASVPYKSSRNKGLVVYSYGPGFKRSLNPNQNIIDIFETMGMECAQKVEVECYHTKNVVNRIWIYGYGSEPCLLYQECLDRLGNPVCNGTQNQCRCNMTEQDWSKTPRDMWFKDTFVLDNMAYVPVRVMRTKGFNLQGQLRMAVGPLVCNSTMPRSSDKIKCNNGKVVPADTRCIYNVDRYGSATGCRDNTHLLNCESFKCPYGFVKCPNSFCIPIKSVCDERMDCMFGEDESFCDTWKCPNQFRCRNSKTCIPLTQVCNGYNDCSSGDDETHCNATCPSFCTCIAGDTDCSMRKRDLRSLTYVSKDTRNLNLNNNRVFLKNDKSFFEGLDYLFELSLAYCEISLIPDLSFWNLKNLHKLDLSFNKLVKISKQSFNGLENLKEIKLEGNKLLSDIEVNSFRFFKDMTILDLSGLSLRKVAESTFQGMSKLQVLNISYNQINTVDGNAFKSLQNLQILDMQQNAISVFGKDSFAGLNTLSFLYTDSYMFCCIKPTSLHINNCFPSPNEFSSCSDLMRNEVLRVFIWSVAIFAFFGNILSFVFRFLSERDTCKCGYGILVTNLSVADMLMGMYLLIVSIADETYRGRYIWNDVSWRNSTYCSLAGGFAIVSMESSVLILTLITLDRFKSTKFLSGFTASYVLVLCAVVWITAIIFAVIPILPLEQMKHYFGESFYSTSAVCLTLPLTTERLSGWRYSTGVLIVFNFFCFVCIAIGQSFIYVTISRTKIMLESPDRRVQFQVSRRLLAIVMVDFLAWFPVCVFGAIALYGGTVSDDAYTWVAAFVMPLKSALNPILYSYSTFSNSRLGRRILKVIRCQTTRVSTGKQVAEHLQNVRKVNKMGCLVSHQDKKYLSLKEYFTSARTIPMMNLVIVTARVAFILDKIHDTGLTVGRFGADHVMVKPDTNKTISKLVMKCLPREVKNEKEKRMNIGDFGKLLGWMLKRYNKQNVGTIEYPN